MSARKWLPSFSLRTMFVFVTLFAIAAYAFKPHEIVITYTVEVPSDLPETVKVSRGLGEDVEIRDAVDWYCRCHRVAWEGYLLQFLTSSSIPCQDVDSDEYFDLFSNIYNSSWRPGLGEVGDRGRQDGIASCRNTLRELVRRHGYDVVKERVQLRYPPEEVKYWSELASLLESRGKSEP